MAKPSKTVNLPVDVAERLEQEPNQSATVEQALREHFNMELNND